MHMNVPEPPEFLDPLTNVYHCYYYAVKAFSAYNDPSTRWLVMTMKANDEDSIRRKMDLSPKALRGRYFQMIDDPHYYYPEGTMALPMFKRKAVLYLTAVGMSIYLRRPQVTEMLLQQTYTGGERLADANEPQFATHVHDANFGDFQAFPPFIVMMRAESFDCATPLLAGGWDPHQQTLLPLRRRNERRVIKFVDWLDAGLCQLMRHSLYPLQRLAAAMCRDLRLYRPSRMPLENIIRQIDENIYQLKQNAFEFSELGEYDKIFGVRSLKHMVEEFGRYQKLRNLVREVDSIKQSVEATGANVELFMSQIGFYDAALEEEKEKEKNKAAAKANNKQPPKKGQVENANNEEDKEKYLTEPCRILVFSLRKDRSRKSLQQCLDAANVFVTRHFFLRSHRKKLGNLNEKKEGGGKKKVKGKKGKGKMDEEERTQQEQTKEEEEVKQDILDYDVGDVLLCLKKIILRERKMIDEYVLKIRSSSKNFKEFKLLESRKDACHNNIKKAGAIMTEMLVQAKMIQRFMDMSMGSIRGREAVAGVTHTIDLQQMSNEPFRAVILAYFNSNPKAWQSIDPETRELLQDMIGARAKDPRKGGLVNSSNANNANAAPETSTSSSCVTYRKVERRRRPSDSQSIVVTLYDTREADSDSSTATHLSEFSAGDKAASEVESDSEAEADSERSDSKKSTRYTGCVQSTDRILGRRCRKMHISPAERRCPTCSSSIVT